MKFNLDPQTIVGLSNLALRLCTLAAKFGLVLFISKNMSLDELGLYGLIATGIVFSIQILGFDFYQYNTREILSVEKLDSVNFIKDQFAFHLFTYLCLCPVAVFCSWLFIDISETVIAVAIGLTIFEHLAQELSRLYITLGRPLFSNTILFVRSGSWVIFFVAYAVYDIRALTLTNLFYFWLIGVLVSLAVGFTPLIRMFSSRWRSLNRINWSWVRKGTISAFPFLIMTIMIQIMDVSDRFVIRIFYSSAEVGVYIFAQNIANLLNTILMTGLVAIVAPKLISAHLKADRELHDLFSRRLKNGILIGGSLTFLMLALAYPLVSKLTGKQEIEDGFWVFVLILGGIYVSVLSLVPYYKLYCHSLDKKLFTSVLYAMIANVALNFVLVPFYGIYGAALSSFIAYSILFFIRHWEWRLYEISNQN